MKKVIRLTEDDLSKLIKKVIREVDETSDATKKIMDLSSEIGSPIDQQTSIEVMACSPDEIEPESNIRPEAANVFQQVKEKIKQMISNRDREGLKETFKLLKSKLKNTKPQQGTPINEQVGLTAAFSLLGISAPLWIWVAIGGLVLFLLIKGIVSLSSWIPKKKGRGCSRTVRYRVR